MSDIQEQTDRPLGEELDDFDVEGHGLREVALGLSAATIVASGAGATMAMAMDNPLPGTTGGVNAAVAGISNDAKALTDPAVSSATTLANQTLDDAARAVSGATTILVGTATPVLDTASTTVTATTTLASETAQSTTALANQIARDPIGTTDKAVDETLLTVREVRDGAVETVDKAATTAVTTASDTASDAVELAGDAYDLVDPSADVDMDDGGTTVTVNAAGKTVSVTTR